MPAKTDYLIVGAGIVGLACAYELRQRFPSAKITLLEKESELGCHASGRNSGVLHSGIYYSPGSLKAQICTSGSRMMRAFARENKIPMIEKGKLILAVCEKDLAGIDQLMKNASENGVRAQLLDEEGIRRIEPQAQACRKGIWVQDTAVVDSRAVVFRLAEILRSQGVEIRTGSKVLSVAPQKNEVTASDGQRVYGFLINCAGAFADKIARFFQVGGNYDLVPFKGIYYKLRPGRTHLVLSNIYPVPREGFPFLGIHLTRHPSGEVYAGPTAIPVLGRENYKAFEGIHLRECPLIFSSLVKMYFSKDAGFRQLTHEEMAYYFKPFFLRQARKLLPALRTDDLVPCGKIGIRPQLIERATGRLEMDYVLKEARGSVHVLNAVSPAFTSAFAFAKVIADKAEGYSR